MRPAAPCGGGSFVALLSGEAFLPGALCLWRQLRRVHSVCPLVLVHDDRPGFVLPQRTRQKLERSFGPANLLPLTEIISRVHDGFMSSNSSMTYRSSNSSMTDYVHAIKHQEPTSVARQRSMLKLFLWALPRERFARVVLLDLDMIVLNNIDQLLNRARFGAPLMAVPCARRGSETYFNSGVVVFEPNLDFALYSISMARWTQEPWRGFVGFGQGVDICAAPGCGESGPTACGYIRNEVPKALKSLPPFRACLSQHEAYLDSRNRLTKACETTYGDQSVLNKASRTFHREGWTPLDAKFNRVWHAETGNPVFRAFWNSSDIVHFVGPTKPWMRGSLRKVAGC